MDVPLSNYTRVTDNLEYRDGSSTSKYRGVRRAPDQPERPWRAEMSVSGETIYIGSYANEIGAALAWDKVMFEWAGQMAVVILNFPPRNY